MTDKLCTQATKPTKDGGAVFTPEEFWKQVTRLTEEMHEHAQRADWRIAIHALSRVAWDLVWNDEWKGKNITGITQDEQQYVLDYFAKMSSLYPGPGKAGMEKEEINPPVTPETTHPS